MNIQVEITEEELKAMVQKKLNELTGFDLLPTEVSIEVKSKQNYKSEWETASFRARVNVRKTLL